MGRGWSWYSNRLHNKTYSIQVSVFSNFRCEIIINIKWKIEQFSNAMRITHTQYKHTVYPKKYAHVFCFAVLCCGYTLTDLPISIRLTSQALRQSDDCPSASKSILMNMDKYFIWIHYERLHNHNKAMHNTTVCIFLGIYCTPLPIPVASLTNMD